MSATTSESGDVPKRQRKVHAKTRTGCKTCKIRKVKCDEAKPHCNRCTSTGRQCDGYPAVQPIHYTQPRSSSPASSSSSLIIPPSLFTSTVPGSAAEQRSFQYFVTNTSSELSGFFKDEFWQGFVLKACWEKDNAALRHAVVGIGALHEMFDRGSEAVEGGVAEGFAVQQYSKAMSHLREVLATTKPSDSPIPALISSVLFVCFDSLRGSYASAMVHLQSGLRILKDARAQIRQMRSSNSRRQGKGISKEEEFIMEKYIAPLLVRLSVQAVLYVDSRTLEERSIIARAMAGAKKQASDDVAQHDRNVDDNMFQKSEWKFETVEDARDKLNFTAEGLFRMTWQCDPELPLSAQSPQALALFKNYSKAYDMWTESFAVFTSQNSANFTTSQVRGTTLIKVHHCILQVMLRVFPSMSDPRCLNEAMNVASTYEDPVIVELFKTTVKLCRFFITAVEQDALKAPGSVSVGKNGKIFSTDLGIVGPLYYVAIKCTVPSLRDEATSLLSRWQGREGMWDANTGGKLVREFWEVEQQFGSRGYNITTNSSGEDSLIARVGSLSTLDTMLGVQGRPANATSRGRVSLVLVEGSQWEWRIRTSNGRTVTIPHKSPPGRPKDIDVTPIPPAWAALASQASNTPGEGSGGSFSDENFLNNAVANFPWELFDPMKLSPPPLDFSVTHKGYFQPNIEYDVGVHQPELFANGIDDWLRQLEEQLNHNPSLLGHDLKFGNGVFGPSQASTPQSFSNESINESDAWFGSWDGRSAC